MSSSRTLKQRTTAFAWAFVDIYAAGSLGYFLLKMIFGNRLWLIALVDNVAAWALLPALPLLALAGWRKRWLRAASLALVSAGFLWLFGDLFLPRVTPQTACASPGDACVDRLRVMSFNLLNDESDPEKVVEEFRKADADIVGLVEYSTRKAAILGEALGDVYPYRVQHGEGIPGIGLLSKYPIVEDEVFWVNPYLPHLRAVVDVDGVLLTVYVAHPTPPAFAPRYTVRGTADIIEISQRATSGGPALVVGDFNMADISDDYRRMVSSGLRDAFREAGFGFGPTWPALGHRGEMPAVVRIDYIWHTSHFTATRAWVGGQTGSDHLPVIADLVWDEK